MHTFTPVSTDPQNTDQSLHSTVPEPISTTNQNAPRVSLHRIRMFQSKPIIRFHNAPSQQLITLLYPKAPFETAISGTLIDGPPACRLTREGRLCNPEQIQHPSVASNPGGEPREMTSVPLIGRGSNQRVDGGDGGGRGPIRMQNRSEPAGTGGETF